MKKIIMINLSILALLFLYGCSAGTELKPSKSANTIDDETAIVVKNGIAFTSTVDEWEGNSEIKDYVTPLKIEIENTSDNPVKISYENFTLVAEDGSKYSALPPISVSGEVDKPVLLREYDPIVTPGFTYNNFYVAPYYSSVYPGVSPYAGTYYFDPIYYDSYYTYWAEMEMELPTAEMLLQALPEGVVNVNGQVSGFVYFDKVREKEDEKVMLKVDLINPETEKSFSNIEISFKVDD